MRINHDDIEALADAIRRAGYAVTAPAAPGRDATGGTVGSLTEAVMGVTAGLCRIADAVNELAEAIREKGA